MAATAKGSSGAGEDRKDADTSLNLSLHGEPALSSAGRGETYSVEPRSLLGASFRSSDDSGSLHSDHAQDYYVNECPTDDDDGDGNASSYHDRNGGVHAMGDDEASVASSIHSLQSCEAIAAYKQTFSWGEGLHNGSYYEDEQSNYTEGSGDLSLNDDESLGFPPGHITSLDESNELQNTTNNHHGRNLKDEPKKSANVSILSPHFFCPITKIIMKDPVITPDGHTFERRAILRSLILEPVDPITKNPLSHEELVEDYLVKQAIDKARKEAWIRFVVEFDDDMVDQEKIKGMSNGRTMRRGNERSGREASYSREYPRNSSQKRRGVLPVSQPPSPHLPSRSAQKNDNLDITSPSTTPSSIIDSSTVNNHGWSVPLGVHQVRCASPGLVVTTDVHRRSTVVKRKIIQKSLVEDGPATSIGTKKSSSKSLLKRTKSKKKINKNLKTTTSVVTRNLVLPPGSHVEILETQVHGGRVRGRIVWEEEVATEMDRKLELLLEEEEVRKRAMARPPKALSGNMKNKMGNRLFRRKSSGGMGDAHHRKLPFTSELFDRPPHHSPLAGTRSRSPSPLTTIKYAGWISLQWAGTVNNHERHEAMKRRRGTKSFVADEDEGPWSQPLPLGVYRVSGDASAVRNGYGQDNVGSSTKQLPLYDAPDSESNIIDFLVFNQCLEVVETQVLVMKRKDNQDSQLGGMQHDFPKIEGKQVVRARCMVPVIVAPLTAENFVGGKEFAPTALQRKFRSGWITINEGENSVTASPIQTGAYIVTTKDPLLSCDSNSKIKAILPSGSCMEVDATRIEFEEKEEMMECHHCGRESMYHTVAVRALIASGGYVTLFVVSVGVSGTHGGLCACGRLVQKTYAEPIPLGTYRITHPTFLTQGSGQKTPVITQLTENEFVQVIETRVEGGCVRGRVHADVFNENYLDQNDGARRKEPVAGWVSLFEPPSLSWAELTSNAAT